MHGKPASQPASQQGKPVSRRTPVPCCLPGSPKNSRARRFLPSRFSHQEFSPSIASHRADCSSPPRWVFAARYPRMFASPAFLHDAWKGSGSSISGTSGAPKRERSSLERGWRGIQRGTYPGTTQRKEQRRRRTSFLRPTLPLEGAYSRKEGAAQWCERE